jgi:hypothetical protein
LLIAFISTFILVFSGCKKEEILIDGNLTPTNRTSSSNLNFTPFNDQTEAFKNDPKMILASGLGSLVSKNSDIKMSLVNTFISSNYRELLVYDFFMSRENTWIYDSLIIELNEFYLGDQTDILELLEECSLMALYMPKEYLVDLPIDIEEITFPIISIFEGNNQPYTFLNNDVALGNSFSGIIFNKSVENFLFNPLTDEIKDCFLTFRKNFSSIIQSVNLLKNIFSIVKVVINLKS